MPIEPGPMQTVRVFHWVRPAPAIRALGTAAWRAGFVLLLLAGPRLGAQAYAPLEEAEMLQPPTAARLAEFAAQADKTGWDGFTPLFRAAALRAYEKGRLPAAERWYQVYRWSALFAETEVRFIPAWIKAMESARAVHANLPQRYTPHKQRLGQWLAPGLQAWLVGDARFSAEFFSLVSPLDFMPEVLRVLNDLQQREPARFERYASLALAIAVVYDLPPPPDWPHGQVDAAALPRRLPGAREAFDWWILQDQLDRTYHRLQDLRADELRFVVDATAPFAELEWSQQHVDLPLGRLAEAYTLVGYRADRVATGSLAWPGGDYTLASIRATGGICVDEAYFATQIGKARGVPTLFFCGEGRDGRHAWFGFLDGNRQWQLNAGRFGEQRLVTGYARDPQTWLEISDHELQFLSERFRFLPAYRSSSVHQEFSALYLQAGDTAAAIRAAWKSVHFEPRNLAAWETLLAAQQKQGDGPKLLEATLYQSIAAFGRYPDLEADFSSRLSRSLRARGQLSAADFEEQRIIAKLRLTRGDLALQRAGEALQRTMTTRPVEEGIQAYNQLVDTLGRGAGIDFYDQIVTPFVRQLAGRDRLPEARQAAGRAYRMLSIPPGSQLEGEFSRLFRELQPGPPPGR